MVTIIAVSLYAEYDRNYTSICLRKKQYAVRVLNGARLQTEKTDFISCTEENGSVLRTENFLPSGVGS